MINEIIIGGYYFDNNVRTQLSMVRNPSILELNQMLDFMCNRAGVVSLEKQDVGEKLAVYIDEGQYFVMLGIYDSDGEYLVFTLHKDKPNSDMVQILGEPYPCSEVTDNFEIVRGVFKEYLETGQKPSTLS